MFIFIISVESDTPTTMTVPGSTVNPDEIDLDDDVETGEMC